MDLVNYQKINKYNIYVCLFVIFMFIIPKAGFKIHSIPITWSYVLIGFYGMVALGIIVKQKNIKISKNSWISIIGMLPFQIILLCSLCFNGYTNKGYAISIFIGLILFPWFYLILFNSIIKKINVNFLLKGIKIAIFIVSVYGIFLFFFKMITGHFIEIPYITVNSGDLGGMESKDIDRGGVFKLISTYNNGNIYGVSLLIFLPFYNWIEKNTFKQHIVKLSLILTLSRTVWIGLFLNELFTLFFNRKLNRHTNRRVVINLFVLAVEVFLSLQLLSLHTNATIQNTQVITQQTSVTAQQTNVTTSQANTTSGFLLDKSLGGRIGQLNNILHFSIFPEQRFDAIAEIVYTSVLKYFGLIGLLFFVIEMAMPLFLYITKKLPNYNSVYKKSLISGILIYLIIACSDGAIQLIPVMSFYWLANLLLLSEQNIEIECEQTTSLNSKVV